MSKEGNRPFKEHRLFDEWPDRYDQWFETPIGFVVKTCEQDLLLELLAPQAGEDILDAGCGTGIFTSGILASDAHVIGLDLSFPMICKAAARHRSSSLPFNAIAGDMMALPFRDRSFDKTVSITALEFIEDGEGAVNEFFRVTKSGGIVVVATLNSLSPWAARRREKTREKETIFSKAIFRSPEEMLALAPFPGVVKTAVHFRKDVKPGVAIKAEQESKNRGLSTGAFVAARWQKP